MIEQFRFIVAVIIAAITAMIVHELPKSIVYLYLNPLQRMQNKKSILKLRQYIDPIGLIFFITSYVGFSKPFTYRIKDKKTNLTLGIVGLASSLVFMLIFYSIYQVLFYQVNIYTFLSDTGLKRHLYYLIESIFRCLVLFNLSIFLVNFLFPIPPFDMSMILASQSPKHYFTLYQYEKILQLVLIVLIAFNIFSFILAPVQQLLF
jgi:hypothetical protein